MKVKIKNALLAVIILAGCASTAEVEPKAVEEPVDDPLYTSCLTEEQNALVGGSEAEARLLLPGTARIIGPDTLITQDYIPNRVNADLNSKGIVTRVWCG